MRALRHLARTPIAAKVPRITVLFWVTKLLTTAMGEAAADYLAAVSIALAAVVGTSGFVIAMVLQFRSRTYRAEVYWFAVAMVAVFGTMAADGLHIVLHVPYLGSTLACLVAMSVVFTWWYRSQRTLSIHSITTRRREAFYWAAVLATFAMGTAIGDLTATTFALGFAGSVVLFAVLIAIPALGWWRLGWNAVASFWAAYVLTRPLGASVADWLGKPPSFGHGLGYGDGPVAVVLTVVIVALVAYTARSRHGIQQLRPDGKARMLYHHLDADRLQDFLASGVLQPSRFRRESRSVSDLPAVLWLTDDPQGQPRHLLAGHGPLRLTIRTDTATRWYDWAHAYRLRRRLRERADHHSGYPAPRRWVLSTPVTLDDCIDIVDPADGARVWPAPAQAETG